jgi:hypothetical protein
MNAWEFTLVLTRGCDVVHSLEHPWRSKKIPGASGTFSNTLRRTMKIFPQLILALSFASLAGAQYASDVLSFNPLGYWQLGASTIDTSGHNSTLNNTATNPTSFSTVLTPPIGSGSTMFGLPNQVLSLSAAASANYGFTTTSKFSALGWIKTVRQDNGSAIVMGKFDPSVVTGWGFVIDNGDLGAPQNAGRAALVFVSGGNIVMGIETTFSVNDGNWHLIGATSDGTGQASGLHLYYDGAVAAAASIPSTGNGSLTNSAPFVIGNAPDASSPFEGNIAGVAIFNTTLTVQQMAQLAEDGATAKAILSQFAFGGGWYSAVYFTNSGTGTVSFPVTFTSDSGNPLIIPSLNSATTTVTLAPGASTIIEAPNSSPNLQQGYVTMALPVFVTGYGLFRQSVAGIADQEAVVPLSSMGITNETLLYDETSNLVTAFALANPTSTANNVTITVTDNNGNLVGTALLPPVPPNSKIENVVNAYVPKITGTRGTVKFTTTVGAANVIGIRFNNVAFSSIPALSGHQLSLFVGAQ